MERVAVDKFSIARALREIGALQSLRGENPFRARAWSRAAEGVESVREPLQSLVAEGRVRDITGVGETIAATIVELVQNGRSKLLDRLRDEVPPGTLELLEVPGLTLPRVRKLHDALGISSVDDLRRAMANGALANVRGFGAKTIERLARGMEEHAHGGEEPMLLVDALIVADALAEPIRAERTTSDVQLAGPLRRMHETVDEIDLAVSTRNPANAIRAAISSSRVADVMQQDASSCRLRLAGGGRAHVVFARPDRFGSLLLRATGPAPHLVDLDALASQRDVDLDTLRTANESDLYGALDLPWIPPEIRDLSTVIDEASRGETFEDLVQLDDLRGAVHCHTTWSDGKASIEEMARAAEALGLEYITITDHSGAAHYANGLDVDRLRAQWDEIERVQEKVKIKLLRGTEADILGDGAIDWPDAILDELDVVIASVHSAMKMDEATMTERLVRAMRHPSFKVWGHALGRLLQRRAPFACDVRRVLDAIAESPAAIEINGDPYRLDLPPKWIPEARARGIRFVVGADAHSTRGLRALRFGVAMARRGGVRRSEVLNTSSASAFARAVRAAA